MAIHEGLTKEQALAYRRAGGEREIEAVDPDLIPDRRNAADEPTTMIMAGYLPAEHPMCPRCGTGLHPIRQNPAGDTLFECVQAGCPGDGYMAIYRRAGPRWEQFAGRGLVDGWQAPIRFGDVQAIRRAVEAGKPLDEAKAEVLGGAGGAAAPVTSGERPGGAWPGEKPVPKPARAPKKAPKKAPKVQA